MKVYPVAAMGYLPNPPRQNRATLSVRFDKHTVKDWDTGEVFDLDPEAAHNMIATLNGWRVTV